MKLLFDSLCVGREKCCAGQTVRDQFRFKPKLTQFCKIEIKDFCISSGDVDCRIRSFCRSVDMNKIFIWNQRELKKVSICFIKSLIELNPRITCYLYVLRHNYLINF